MTRSDRIALVLSLLTVVAAYWLSGTVYEQMPHLEDEFAYVWQAQVIANGELTIESPPYPRSFLVPFVVDYEGRRFGKYPLGWPVVLSLGERWGMRAWVNPLLAGLGVWLIYRLGKRMMGETVGLLAAGLTMTSPFFWMNSVSLLSHAWGLVLSAAFALFWVDGFHRRDPRHQWLAAVAAGLCLGVLALSRPWTMVGVALPFGIHGIVLLVTGNRDTRLRVITIGVIGLTLGLLHFVWQYALTGDPLLNPYTLWWEYDKVGFGPGHGVMPEGHNLALAKSNTKHSLRVGLSDLFGWARLSWLFLPFGLWAIRKQKEAWTISAVFPSLVLVYLVYWVGAWVLGPRYYYEGLYSLTILSGAGIAWAAGWPLRATDKWPRYDGWSKARPLAITALVAFLVSVNFIYYTPQRLGDLHGLYGISRSRMEPFLLAQEQGLTPALVFVKPEHWTDYGTLLELTDPYFQSPYVLVYGVNFANDIRPLFPDRKVFYYYPDEPYTFYETPRKH